MLCSVCGKEMNEEKECRTCNSEAGCDDASATNAWTPDPAQPMDFKATMATATRPEPPQYGSPDAPLRRMSPTWLTLGLLVAVAIGVMVYLALS